MGSESITIFYESKGDIKHIQYAGTNLSQDEVDAVQDAYFEQYNVKLEYEDVENYSADEMIEEINEGGEDYESPA